MNQLKLENSTADAKRGKMFERVTISFRFISDWIKKCAARFFKPIV